MTAKSYKLIRSSTTVSVLSGFVLAIAYLASNEQEDAYLFVLAEFVAVACIVGWLFNSLLIALSSLAHRLSSATSSLVLSYARLPEEGSEWAKIQHRREMIERRLEIDEPRFCSRRGISCNCWTFCGEDPAVRAEHSATASSSHASSSPGYLVGLAHKNTESHQETDSCIEIKSKDASILTIEDRNVSDCSFH